MFSMRSWIGWALAATALAGCKRSSGPSVPNVAIGAPDAASRSGPPQGAGTVLRYVASGRTLEQRAHLELVQRGAGQFAEAALDLHATTEVAPQDDRLKVVWSVIEVDGLELAGALQDTNDTDTKAFLLEHGRGSYLCDLRGQAHDDPRLPENAERESKLAALRDSLRAATEAGKPVPAAVGLQMLSYLPPLVQLPSLPEQTLPLGEPVRVTREEETELGDSGLLLPFDVEMTYTLVRIDSSGGPRIAEMTFSGAAIGSTEGPGGEIIIESKQSGMLLFNLDTHVPVSYESSRNETVQMGEATGETETTIRSTWEG